ncbi:MAG TPA: hypothetical protein VEK79_06925 [Thermoanaerobaculia bacterium]|nr:hypothetical protein [Thermoanaerobaculia bacterium]
MQVVPGQWWQRGLAVILGAATAWLFFSRTASAFPGALRWVAAVLFVLFALLSVAPLYRRWMVFAEWLGVWVTRAIFSLIYLLVVPIVRLLYALSGGRQRHAGGISLWIPKRAHDHSLDDLERMG